MRSRYRIHTPEIAHFVTSTIVEWLPIFTSSDCCDIVVRSLLYCRENKGLKIYAWVILPNHFHAILAGPDLSRTLADLKKFTAREILDKFDFDVQIVSAPITDGSLSSCPPSEAVTWGKVDRDTYTRTTESMQGDFSVVMPLLTRALLENRARYEQWRERMGEEALFAKHPKARGYLRPTAGYELFGRREELGETLTADVKNNREWLLDSLTYPLASSR